jgi:citrate lyase subunit beta/citryl-CoA lyase
MLWVPGDRSDRAHKAADCGADAVVLDLEDAVAPDAKARARQVAATVLGELADRRVRRFVRVNAWGGGLILDDLSAVVGPALDGVVLPKTEIAEDIRCLDRLLTELETVRGLVPGGIEIVPLPETASGLYHIFDIAKASTRIVRVPACSS